jgi:hypothetical protein
VEGERFSEEGGSVPAAALDEVSGEVAVVDAAAVVAAAADVKVAEAESTPSTASPGSGTAGGSANGRRSSKGKPPSFWRDSKRFEQAFQNQFFFLKSKCMNIR